MCIGIGAALGAVLSIGQAMASYSSAAAQAEDQNRYHEQNRRNAVRAAADRYSALARKADQEDAAASQKMVEKRVEGLQAKSKAKAAAATSNVTGLSVNALLADFEAQQARGEAAINLNLETRRKSLEDEADATYHNTISRINSVRTARKPSPLGYILQGLGGAMKGIASG
jgi:hypothetical protein